MIICISASFKLSSYSSNPDKQAAEVYPDVSAVGGEVHLDDEAGDALTVATPTEGRARGQVIKVHTVLLGAHSQVLLIWTESA